MSYRLRSLVALALAGVFACGKPRDISPDAAPHRYGGALSPQGGTIVGATPNGGLFNSNSTLGLLQTCSSAQVLAWSGTAWLCANQSGGGLAAVTASDPLSGSGSAGSPLVFSPTDTPPFTGTGSSGSAFTYVPVVSSPLSGSGSSGNPLAWTPTLTAPLAGTGSAGSALNYVPFVTSPIAGTGSAGNPLHTALVVASPLSGAGSSGSTLGFATAATSCGAGSDVNAINSAAVGTCTAVVDSIAAGTGLNCSTTTGAATCSVNLSTTSCSAGSGVSAISATGVGTCTADITSASTGGASTGFSTSTSSGVLTGWMGSATGCSAGSGEEDVTGGSGGWQCVAWPTGTVTSSTLTSGTIPKATGAAALGNSNVTDNGTTVTINEGTSMSPFVVAVGSAGNVATSFFENTSNSGGVQLLCEATNSAGTTQTGQFYEDSSGNFILSDTAGSGYMRLRDGTSGGQWYSQSGGTIILAINDTTFAVTLAGAIIQGTAGATAYLQQANGSAAALSAAGTGQLIYNSTTNTPQYSANGGARYTLGSSSGNVYGDGSTGSSGNCNVTSGTVTLTAPIYCTTLNVSVGATLKTGGYPVFATVSATIAGTITTGAANGATGSNFAGGLGGAETWTCVGTNECLPAGEPGGTGGESSAPIVGTAAGVSSGKAGGGAAGATGGNCASGGAGATGAAGGAVVNPFTKHHELPFAVGSYVIAYAQSQAGAGGGGGGGVSSTNSAGGGGGGAGGGYLVLASPSILGAGSISAQGGNGGNGYPGTVFGGGGGGGGGGIIVLVTGPVAATPVTFVGGGAGGASGGGTSTAGANGSTGTLVTLTN